jgi:hypothetical protein
MLALPQTFLVWMAHAVFLRASRAQAGPSTGSAVLLEASAESPIPIANQDGELFFPDDATLANRSTAKRLLERVSRTEMSAARTVCLYAHNTFSLTPYHCISFPFS